MSGSHIAAGTQSGSNLQGLKRIWDLMGDKRPRMVRSMVFRLLQSMSLGFAYGGALWVITDLMNGRTMDAAWVWQITGLMVLSLLLQLLFSFLSVRDAWEVSFEIGGDLRQRLLDRLRALPLGFHLTRQKGDLANTIGTDITMVEGFLSEGTGKLIQAFGLPLAVFLFMLTQDWRLAVAMVVPIALAIPIMSRMGRRLADAGIARQDQQAEASSRMIEFVLGIKVIRAFGRMREGNERFHAALNRFRDISIEMVHSFVLPVMGFITVVMLGLPVTFLATGWTLESLDPGVAITALVLAYAMYGPIIALISVTETVRMAEASLIRIDRVLTASPLSEPQIARVPEGNAIAVRDLRFGYDEGRDVLHGISFDVPERSMTAIVGPSGAGKSTVLNLIARFWDPTGGQISLGGVPLDQMTSDQLLDRISFVFQDVYLFSGSIAANIRMGRPGATDDEVIRAAQLARAHDFIMTQPDGYATEIGEGGARLSGGERQRIAIARAILKDTPIVLLDEATAAIDPINERAIQEALANLVADRTLIVVAHKLSTIEAADQILVMQAGRIAERGTHAALLNESGLYASLFQKKSQSERWTL